MRPPLAAMFLVIGMAGNAAAMTPLYLECKVAPGRTEAEFAEAFCTALAKHLQQDLNVGVLRTPPHGSLGVVVGIKLQTEHSAEVVISTGKVGAGGFVETKSTSTHLSSYDRGLSIAAARTLVRPIGVQLGLIR